jgi:23S rRNA (uracil1939-C5)-methyltransferase
MSRSVLLDIESLDHEARGIARDEGKVVFVDAALPGERVVAQVFKKKPKYNLARTTDVLKSSWLRVTPRCKYFGICGGCAMQHLASDAQVAVKQRVLEDAFTHLADLKPQQMLAPIHGPAWGYRYRARLTVRWVARKGSILVGFHEKRSSFVADMTSCEVLPPSVSALLVPLRRLIERMSAPDRLPQIEVAVGQDVIALVLRHLDALAATDLEVLRDFARQHNVQWWLQPKGPDTVQLLPAGDHTPLSYALPEFGLTMPFRPTDFTQVNHQINRVLVVRAIQLLGCEPQDRVLDLFCGLGNFTLALAKGCAEVLGIEGSQALVDRAKQGALLNKVSNAHFEMRNLFEFTFEDWAALEGFDRILIDPPREGAFAVCEALAQAGEQQQWVKRIVYVSCNPATLARDAAVLCHKGNYRLTKAGVVNMFPHTGHVESIAVFEPTGEADAVIHAPEPLFSI